LIINFGKERQRIEKDKMVQRVTARVGDADLILETGRIGKQANGCVFAQWGGAAVIATVCASHDAVEGMDYVLTRLPCNAFGRIIFAITICGMAMNSVIAGYFIP